MTNKTDQLKPKKITMKKQSTSLRHGKEKVRLNALIGALKANELQPSDIPPLLLDDSDMVRHHLIKHIKSLQPIRLFGPILSSTIAGGLSHILPSIRKDMALLFITLIRLPGYTLYFHQATFKSLLTAQVVHHVQGPYLEALSLCHMLPQFTTIQDELSSSPQGLIPSHSPSPPLSSLLHSIWKDTTHVQRQSICRLILYQSLDYPEETLLEGFPYTGTDSRRLNTYICCISPSEDTLEWLRTHAQESDLALPLNSLHLSAVVSKLHWKGHHLDKRLGYMSQQSWPLEATSSLFRLLFIAVGYKHEPFIQYCIKHIQQAAQTVVLPWTQLKPLIALNGQNGPLFQLPRPLFLQVLHLFQYAPNELFE